MGYQPKRKTYSLKFEGDEHEGLEVRTRGLNFGDFLKLRRLVGLSKETPEDTDKLLSMFAEHLLSWNLEEDGIPVPTTLAGVLSQDPEFVLVIISAWIRAVSAPFQDAPQETASPALAAVASIPMQTIPAEQQAPDIAV